MDSLHVVELAHQALHWLVLESQQADGVLVFVVEVGSKGAVVGLAVHEVGGEFEVHAVGESLDEDAVYSAVAFYFAHEDECGWLCWGGDSQDGLSHEGVGGFGGSLAHHHGHHVLAFLLDAGVGHFPGLGDLEEFSEGDGDVEFESLDEFVLSCDGHDWIEEVLKAGDFSREVGVGGGVVLFGGSV